MEQSWKIERKLRLWEKDADEDFKNGSNVKQEIKLESK